MQWEDINYKSNFGQGLRCYGQSKLANLLFTRYLAIKLSTENISVNASEKGGKWIGHKRTADEIQKESDPSGTLQSIL